jgi:hypothetical protein
LGVSYNVGYFIALDIYLFPLFSLADHTLFALQALPLVFLSIFFRRRSHCGC